MSLLFTIIIEIFVMVLFSLVSDPLKMLKLFCTCALHAIRNYIAQAKMMKLNPAGN